MQLGYGLYQQQTQKLIMTPQLRQAIAILQFSALELTEYLHKEIIENPVFEIEEKEIRRFDFLYQNFHRANFNYQKPDEQYNIWDTIVVENKSLEDYLLEQARFLSLNRKEYEIIKYLIGCLDNSGYLQISMEEVSEYFNIGLKDVEMALTILQSFEPIGVGARNLKEALLIQLKRNNSENPQLVEIINNYLEDIGNHNFNKIAQKLKITVQEVQRLADYIKTLNPKPAINFHNEMPKYIVPDIIVEELQGEYVVIVNDTLIPRLKLNHYYYQYLKRNRQDEASKYIMAKFNSAKWLIKSIDQRRNTLYKVTSAIIKHQKSFFANKTLKPLTLKIIAEEIGVHESTVSRAVNQKYVQTPLGIYELKQFFSNALLTNDGDITSVEDAKKVLRELIDQEDKGCPLSDQKICDLLNDKGINISRRTIAKYRDELGILSSAKRKRY